MSKNITVDAFIDNVVQVYSLRPFSSEKKRELKFKLGMAEVKNVVNPNDTKIALDIILETAARPIVGTIKTASAHVGGSNGLCPRCHQLLVQAKLADSREVGYCQNCQISVV
jgi:hypothetical protein